MAGFRLPSLKSLANLSRISARVSTGPQHFQQLKKFQNLVQHRHRSSTASSVNLSSERINDNVVYSRHEDCFLHTQTMVQRFFEQASLWPNHTAVVSRLISLFFITIFEERKTTNFETCVCKHEHVGWFCNIQGQSCYGNKQFMASPVLKGKFGKQTKQFQQ